MSFDVIALIKKERERLLDKIISPHLPGWPEESEGVTFRLQVGTQLVFINNALVGAVTERSCYRAYRTRDIRSEIANSFEYWRTGPGV